MNLYNIKKNKRNIVATFFSVALFLAIVMAHMNNQGEEIIMMLIPLIWFIILLALMTHDYFVFSNRMKEA